MDLPSGYEQQFAMEAMAHRNRWFTVLKNGGSFHGYVK